VSFEEHDREKLLVLLRWVKSLPGLSDDWHITIGRIVDRLKREADGARPADPMWVSLRVYDDWGMKYLQIHGKGLIQGAASYAHRLNFRDGDTVTVRTKSHSVFHSVVIKMETRVSHVRDHGRVEPSEVRYPWPTVRLPISAQGGSRSVGLEELEILESSLPRG
jgi:hypothetical protein